MAQALMQNAELRIETLDSGDTVYSITGDCLGETITLDVPAELVRTLGQGLTSGMKVEATLAVKKKASEARITQLSRKQIQSRVGTPRPRPDRTSSARPRGQGERRGAAAEGWKEIFGAPFHNPYTFIPFFAGQSERHAPSLRTADEREPQKRYTGTIELAVEVVTPVKTVEPEPAKWVGPDEGHPVYSAQRIGNDVIVPATGIRGALRNLITIVSGGPLGQVDEHAVLHQGRTVNLGPGPQGRTVFLAEVLEPRSGRLPTHVRLGETYLVQAKECEDLLEEAGRSPLKRPDAANPRGGCDYWVEIGKVTGQIAGVAGIEAVEPGAKPTSAINSFRLKLSGSIKDNNKKEGVFLPDPEREIELQPALWSAFESVHRHSDMQGSLKAGDLVWLETVSEQCRKITCSEDVKSIQWSRWGREGPRMIEVMPEGVRPDYFREDGLVADNTDLFGMVDPMGPGPSFAGRVRPENLVFDMSMKGNGLLRDQILAPLSQPRPGCLAFYRSGSAQSVSNQKSDMLGYKVYRTQKPGEPAPWFYPTQPIFDGKRPKELAQQKANQTCDLVAEGSKGLLRICFRSLSGWELWMILEACRLPWRLGGGKPLGLGLCKPTVLAVRDEMGESIDPEELEQVVAGDASLQARVERWRERAKMWRASQLPVPRLRYPRLTLENQCGGHVWFSHLATPSKNGDGLQPVRLDESLGGGSLQGQILPEFDPDSPQSDVLYGYDVEIVGKPVREVKPVDRTREARPGGGDAPAPQNSKTRLQARRDGR